MADTELRLLLVEEARERNSVLGPILGEGDPGVTVARASDEPSLVALLSSPWDVVIADHGAGGLTGEKVLGLVHDRWPLVPVIVVSEQGGEDLAVEMMRRGASDFIGKAHLARVSQALPAILGEARVRQGRASADARAVRLGRLFRLRAEVNRAIVRIGDSQQLLQEVCRLALGLGSFGQVRVCQTNDGNGPRVVASEGTERGDVPAVFPLVAEGDWGTLELWTAVGESFTPEEMSFLKDLADDIGFGLLSRQKDQKRRETEQFLTDMASLVPGVFYKLKQSDQGLQFDYVSPGIDLLLPLSPAQVLADASLVLGACHPVDRRRMTLAGIRSRDYLTVFNLQFRLLRPNGTVVWVLATAFPQKQSDGAVVWTGLAIDVSPQNKLQEALKREQDLLAVILNNIGDGVVAVDGNGVLTLVNRTAYQLLDKEPEGESPRMWTTLDPELPWGARERFTPWVRRRPDGTELHLEAHVTDLLEAGQGRRGCVMVLRDMTERDRTADRLRQSEKLESIGLLAGGIAHDFNNLLTGVFGFIQLARMNADEADKVASYLDSAMGPFHRARTLTQQLLTFAKGGEPAKATLALPHLLTRLAQFTLAGSRVSWSLTPGEPVWNIVANEAQVHQVFENLFLNAKQALEDRGGTLVVTIRNVPEPGPVERGVSAGAYVEVLVEDDGPGIAPDILPKVFDPFFTTKASGTGLGLSICFSVVKKHGGTIEVESTLGKGTRFRVFWPAIPDQKT